MAWTPGQTGNPAGRPKDSKIWQDAIKRALTRKGRGLIDMQAIDQVADALIDVAIMGDIAAIKELGDRLDGKATNFVVVENRTAFDEMSLDELGRRDKEIAQRIERLQAVLGQRSGAPEAGSLPTLQ